MKKRNQRSILGQSGIRLEVVTTRSSLYPQWWEFWARYKFWRLRRRVQINHKRLSPQTRYALDKAERALEHEFLYGRGAP